MYRDFKSLNRAQTEQFEETKRPNDYETARPFDDGEKTPQPRSDFGYAGLRRAETQPINDNFYQKKQQKSIYDEATPQPGGQYGSSFGDYTSSQQRKQHPNSGESFTAASGSNITNSSNGSGRVKLNKHQLQKKEIIDDDDLIFFDDEYLDEKPKNNEDNFLESILRSRIKNFDGQKSQSYSELKQEIFDKMDLDIYDQQDFHEEEDEEIDYQNYDWDNQKKSVSGFSEDDPLKYSTFVFENKVFLKKFEELNKKLAQIRLNSLPKQNDVLMFQEKHLFISADQLQQTFRDSAQHNDKLKINEWVKETQNIQKELNINFKEDSEQDIKLKFKKEIQKDLPLFSRIKKSMASMIKDNSSTNRYGYLDKLQQYQTFLFQDDIYVYAATNNIAKLSKAIESDFRLADKKTEINITPLYLACKYGQTEVVQYLIQKKANINQPSLSDSTALHAASYYGHKKTVELLLLNGADQSIKNKYKKTPYQESNKDMKKVHDDYNNNHSALQYEIKQNLSQKYYTLAQKLYIKDEQGEEHCQGYFCKISYERCQNQQLKLLKFLDSREQYQKAYYSVEIDNIQQLIQEGIQAPINEGSQLYQYNQGVFLQTSISDMIMNPEVQSMKGENNQNYKCIVQVMVPTQSLEWDNSKQYYDCKVNNAEDILISGVFYLNKDVFDLIKINNMSQFQKTGKCLLKHNMTKPEKISGVCDICGSNSMKFQACYKPECMFFKCNTCITKGRILP